MYNPLVTIAIPFYNSGEYLKYAVKSVLNQTYANWELILLNDGSTDNYEDIISEFEDKRIRFINDGYQLGLPARLNQLSLIAHGEYYARMDADDIMHPQRIELQVEFLVKHPEIDVVGSYAYYIDKDNSILGVSKELYQQPKTIVSYRPTPSINLHQSFLSLSQNKDHGILDIRLFQNPLQRIHRFGR